MPLISPEGLVHFWQETKEEDDPYIMVTIRGRFKVETHRKWVGHRRVWIQGEEGEALGMLFCKSAGGKVRIADYEPVFVDAMNRLHESQPELFLVGTCLENFSLRRLMRRGVVLAVGGKVSEHVVNLMNR